MADMLKDKVAIITGAGRGIGRAYALRFAEEGAKILLPDINLENARHVVDEIINKGGVAEAIETDVSDEKSTLQMAERAVQNYGRIDILLNNAGIWDGLNATPWDNWKIEDWERIYKVNVIGMWLCCKAVVPFMVRQSRGKIINIASSLPKVPVAQFYLPYSCSKGAVYTLTHSLARALGTSGINVNAISPGYTASEASLNQIDSDRAFKGAMASQVFHRNEKPADVVGTAVFLSSPDSDFISGQIIFVDGGTVMY